MDRNFLLWGSTVAGDVLRKELHGCIRLLTLDLKLLTGPSIVSETKRHNANFHFEKGG